MIRITQLILLVSLLLVLAVSLGCPKKEAPLTSGPTAGPPGGPTTPGPGPAVGETGSAEGPAADFAAKQAKLKSYIMTMSLDGKPMGKHAMKMENGKPVATKMEMPGDAGYMLVQMDKQVTYIVDPKAKTAMKMSTGGKDGAHGGMPGMDDAPGGMPKMSDLKDVEAAGWSTETLDGVECWKVTTPGESATTIWVDKEYGLARKMMTGKQVITQKYEKINAVPDSEFVLPDGIKVQDMPAMPNMPTMPKG